MNDEQLEIEQQIEAAKENMDMFKHAFGGGGYGPIYAPPEPPVHHTINDNPDSIEIGTPAKGGAVKIYGDFNKPEDFEVKVANAERVKKYAQERLG